MSRAPKMIGKYEAVTITSVFGDVRKVCTFCGEEKDIKEFAKNGINVDGSTRYRDDCKVCYNARRKENKTKGSHSRFISHQKHRGEEDIDYTFQEWKEAIIYFGGTCAYCGCTPRKGKRLTKDHLEPVSQGGKTEAANIVPACFSCNSSKGADDFKEWFMKQDFFSQDRLNKIFKWRSIMRQLEERDQE